MDDLINLKKSGYNIVDFGGVENSSLAFKKKFHPSYFYKTHIFSIVPLTKDIPLTKNLAMTKIMKD